MELDIAIKVKSPIHLGSGREEINLDADVVHDEYGLPYFPAKRFKGLLYESALEVLEMSELSGSGLITQNDLKEVFHHDETSSDVQLVMSDFYMESEEEYKKITHELGVLEKNYPDILKPVDVLEAYTSIRYQTALINGIAQKGSLRVMRVVDSGITFRGSIQLWHGSENHLRVIALALRNLKTAGLKRNRGFGNIICSMKLDDGRTEQDLIDAAIKEVGKNATT